MVKAEGSSGLIVQQGAQETEIQLHPTGEVYTDTELGTIEIAETGNQLLQLKPDREGWSAIELGQVVLVKE